ncbi:phytanoyl-CoA dioxygenase family protein [Hyalangium gracile]|uniref:phytanoyl-CoA dioxygenase family protein n=1 Tax=Hyalangium gracile TaxID=394092 RepID=UPI001CCD9906|nr:phytanoyl-CoA dioxygenase family protein [Hyalangium gracile]
MMREFLKQRVLDAGRLALQKVEQYNPGLAQRLRQEAKQILGRPAAVNPAPVAAPPVASEPPRAEVKPKIMEFEPATLPWLDKPEADIEGYVKGLGGAVENPEELIGQLRSWRDNGFVILPRAIEPELIDALLADVDELFTNCSKYSILINSESKGIRPARDFKPEDFTEHHSRVLDFHNNSIAGKRISLHPKLVKMLEHIFREPIVAMQSLTFTYGSEQTTHADYAYVVPRIPSHLAATWVALEDIKLEAGPLGYFPGSHHLPKFDFGNGIFLTPESTKNEFHFRDHLEAQCRKAGIERQIYLPKKGDVFVWHGSLAHQGSPQLTPGLTRKAFVTHYSTVRAYPYDRRQDGVEPKKHYLNGGVIYSNPKNPKEEDIFTRGGKV